MVDPMDFSLQTAQKLAILKALTYMRGNMTKTALILKTSHQTLYRMVAVHGIDVNKIRELYDRK
jgi:DNA-binding NtrC family response regulator